MHLVLTNVHMKLTFCNVFLNFNVITNFLCFTIISKFISGDGAVLQTKTTAAINLNGSPLTRHKSNCFRLTKLYAGGWLEKKGLLGENRTLRTAKTCSEN